MLIVTVNNKKFEIEKNSPSEQNVIFKVNGKIMRVDLKQGSTNFYSIIMDNRSYNAEIQDENPEEKTMAILVENIKYEIKIEDEQDQMLDKLGMRSSESEKIKLVGAPMPGLVTSIKVKEHQQIMKGDPLLVLEAMKMENIIKAPADGVVSQIFVHKNDPVEKGQKLIELS